METKNLFNDYYEKYLFFKLVKENYGSKYNSFDAIKKDYDIDEKTVYRKRTLVS